MARKRYLNGDARRAEKAEQGRRDAEWQAQREAHRHRMETDPIYADGVRRPVQEIEADLLRHGAPDAYVAWSEGRMSMIDARVYLWGRGVARYRPDWAQI